MLYPEDINYNKLNGILSIKTVYLIYTRLLVYAILILAYSKGPCVYLKVNMYKICCMISFCSKTFYDVLYNL